MGEGEAGGREKGDKGRGGVCTLYFMGVEANGLMGG